MAEEVDQIKKLKIKRGHIKGKLTRFEAFLSNLEQRKSEVDVQQLLIRLERATPLLEEFEVLQEELEFLEIEEETERLEFEERYFEAITRARQFKEKHIKENKYNMDAATGVSQINTQGRLANLPKINLPRFDGAYEDYQPFIGLFKSMIGNRVDLPDIQKFQYLIASLGKAPQQVIASLEVSEENYQEALELLQQRYYNKKYIVNTHMQSILRQPKLSKGSAVELRQIVDVTNKHIRALATLGQPVDGWDTILINVLAQKLDKESRKVWEDFNHEGDLPTLKEFNQCILKRCRGLESVNLADDQIKPLPKVTPGKEYRLSSNVAHSQLQLKCIICSESHRMYQCPKFIGLSPEDRFKQIKQAKLCINCLNKNNHNLNKCPSGVCKVCQKKHNTLLHFDNAPVQSQGDKELSFNKGESTSTREGSSKASTSTSTSLVCQSGLTTQPTVLLATAVVYVWDVTNTKHTVRVLLDSGAQSNFISSHTAKRLGLPRHESHFKVSGIAGSPVKTNSAVNCTIASRFDSFQVNIEFIILNRVTIPLPSQNISINQWNIPSDIHLADPNFNQVGQIDMIIGAEVFFEIMGSERVTMNDNLPRLHNTKLGWVVAGRMSNEDNESNNLAKNTSVFCACTEESSSLEKQLQQFWKIENCIRSAPMNLEEKLCEKIFTETTHRDNTGRFIVTLPTKDLGKSTESLGESREIAIRRFLHIEKRFKFNPSLKEQYSKFIHEYRELKHMELVSREIKSSEPICYLPHHAVINNNSLTTKLRVVFDASCKTSTGISLNDVLLKGPTVQDDLFSIILRFRKYPFVLSADIEKMYRQIKVEPFQTNLQRIVWRDSPLEPLQTYRLLTVTYGTSAAPYLATRCLQQLASEVQDKDPDLSRVVAHDFYVDDLLTGGHSIDEVLEIKTKITALLDQAGFRLHKWCANNHAILETTNPADRDTKYTLSSDKNEPALKTLGVWWNPHQDTFQFECEDREVQSLTKRGVLSHIARTFDPLGLLGPVMAKSKIFMQRLWEDHCSWDEPLSLHLSDKWMQFAEEFRAFRSLRIPRGVFPHPVDEVEIHTFCDASELAYGACIYVRGTTTGGQVSTFLLTSKSRVSPLKKLSIPRLELCGAVLAAQLLQKVKAALQLPKAQYFCWTDSSIVLAWLRSPSARWKTFVANRVAEIQELTSNHTWRHVNSEGNPADYLSRGMNPGELINCTTWWNGPTWLREPPEKWPMGLQAADPPEAKGDRAVFVTITSQQVIDIHTYSSYNRLSRVIAYALRFIHNSRCRKETRIIGELKSAEIEKALILLVKLIQEETFFEDIANLKKERGLKPTSKLISLHPFLDSKGILRVGGRLENSTVPIDQKFPMLLPKGHHFTLLIARQEHRAQLHAGPQMLLASLRRRFWPLGGRQLVKKVVRECITCFRVSPKPASQQMGNLPRERVEPTRPFWRTGIDYCGPFTIRSNSQKTRRAHLTKAYVAIFVCFATKAVHLELVSDLTTAAFLSTLRRFSARRGVPKQLFSDNASTFVGANNELKSFLNANKFSKDIESQLSTQGIEWHFIPPRAPNFGGLWEAAVKSCKYHMKRIIGEAHLSFEEMTTCIAQIEACLNSRPLTPMSDDPNDLSFLTPGHFLVGDAITAHPEPDLVPFNSNRLRRWQRMQQLYQLFWKRWSTEYLTNLQQRVKWFKKKDNISVGDIVLIKDQNTTPLQWKLARVQEVYLGHDSLARVALLKTSSGLCKRSVRHLCPLPMDDQKNESS